MWRSIARGLAVGAVGTEDYSKLPISFHPAGPSVSSKHFADEPWLAFHSAQSGHNKDQQRPHALIDQALRTEPLKPVVDYEPPYDDLLRGDQAEWGRNDDVDARKIAKVMKTRLFMIGAKVRKYGRYGEAKCRFHPPRYSLET